jgi:tRNA threonylcarbamoyladenosine biosynthesis protein TsaB
MTGILAIETSADACSVALAVGDGEAQERFEVAPRRHNRIIFDMLQDLVPGGDLRSRGVDCLAYGAGPGSFTGLRIAASAVQGLAFSNDLPAVGVSTLAALAQGALEEGAVPETDKVLSLIDARVGEVYCGVYRFERGIAVPCVPAWVALPQQLELPGSGELFAVGDGLRYAGEFPAGSARRIVEAGAATAPRARSLLAIARDLYTSGEYTSAAGVQPVYVRDEIAWKKLSEQGKPQ